MNEYEIEIKETLTKKVIVQAKDINEAKNKAWDSYYAAEDDYILTADNSVVEADIKVVTEQKELFNE